MNAFLFLVMLAIMYYPAVPNSLILASAYVPTEYRKTGTF